MSRTRGHRITCRRSNCWSCGKGVFRRLDNTRRRRADRVEAAQQLTGQ